MVGFFHRVAAKTGFEPPNMDHNGIQESIGVQAWKLWTDLDGPSKRFKVVVTHISNPWANHEFWRSMTSFLDGSRVYQCAVLVNVLV
jgi:hypothetical protein